MLGTAMGAALQRREAWEWALSVEGQRRWAMLCLPFFFLKILYKNICKKILTKLVPPRSLAWIACLDSSSDGHTDTGFGGASRLCVLYRLYRWEGSSRRVSARPGKHGASCNTRSPAAPWPAMRRRGQESVPWCGESW